MAALLGNYYGINDQMVTVMEGLAAAIEPGSQMQYRPGVLLDRPNVNPIDWSSGNAAVSNVTLAVLRLIGLLEGEEGAVADIIFGKSSPSGKLPLAFPKSLDQLPPYEDYSMEGRTYRYMEAEPLYPFGFGLSYTTFEYFDIKLSSKSMTGDQSVKVKTVVRNTVSS